MSLPSPSPPPDQDRSDRMKGKSGTQTDHHHHDGHHHDHHQRRHHPTNPSLYLHAHTLIILITIIIPNSYLWLFCCTQSLVMMVVMKCDYTSCAGGKGTKSEAYLSWPESRDAHNPTIHDRASQCLNWAALWPRHGFRSRSPAPVRSRTRSLWSLGRLVL